MIHWSLIVIKNHTVTYKKPYTHETNGGIKVTDMTICCDGRDFETGVRVMYVSQSHGFDCGAVDKIFSP